MTQLRTNDNDDLDISGNTFSLTDNNSDEEIVQRLKQRLKFFFGEWFLDNTRGVPWFQVIFEKNAQPAIIETVLKDAIIGTPGVSFLNKFGPIDYDPKTRLAKVAFDVTTINGNNLSISEVLP